MSTIKSSAENLTLNADGANNDIKFQSNGTEVASIDQAGLVTASGVSLAAGGTLTTASGNDLNIVYPDSRSLFIKEAGTTHVAVDNTGKVGIGTASPTTQLDVTSSGNGEIAIISGTSGITSLYMGDSAQKDKGKIFYHNGSDYMAFNANGGEKLRIQTAGGISFNGDTAAANALDDYEEGTWTANWTGGSPSGGNTTGYYLKVGNLVHIQYYSSATTIGSVSGAARLSNLPYAPLNSTNHHTVISYCHGTAVTGAANCYLDHSNATIYWVSNDSTSSPSFVAGSSKFLMITGTYRTA